jgi:NADPH:quinone reductase-like Zn-dependent oxidoreductase
MKTIKEPLAQQQSRPEPADMRAVVHHAYAQSAVRALRLSTVARPTPAANEVLVRVHAAGLDRGAWHIMTGLPYALRLAFGLRRPKNPVLGHELAGTVVSTGSAVTRFAVGDEVFGNGGGSFAEYAVAPEGRLAHKPLNVTFEQAAVVPISALTALQGLRDAGRIKPGHHVLVLGASGGVGSFAVQLAKAFGAEVTGVASAAKLDLVRSLGADHVLDYAKVDFAAGEHRYDLILDLAGNPSVRRLHRALTPTGTAVLAGGEEGGRLTGGMGRQLRAIVRSLFGRRRMRGLLCKESAADLETLAGLIANHEVTPRVDRTYPLDQVPDAMRHLAAGDVRGKVAITLTPTVVLPE